MKLYDWYRNTLRNPKYRWWIILGTLVYLISPIDISPDFLPIIGQIDDAAIAALLIAEVSQLFLDRIKSAKTNASTQPPTASDAASGDSVDVKAVSVD